MFFAERLTSVFVSEAGKIVSMRLYHFFEETWQREDRGRETTYKKDESVFSRP